VQGEIPDYQAAAFLMAVYFQGMTDAESADLTLSMANSGEVLNLSDAISGVVVDKHSTGGVGDKVSLIVGPMVAACGVPVGKMSGRGLGFTGGTLDKLESIPGFQVALTTEEFKQQLREIGVVIAGQSANLAPADGKFYALRDVTGTVPALPLIASSIMSKKIAGGAHKIVLDVKVGTGAFMKDLPAARALSALMVKIGAMVGREVVCLLSDMNQPLGVAVGNSLEVQEAVLTLQGQGPADLTEHCLVVAAHMLVLAGKFPTLAQAKSHLAEKLAVGDFLFKLKEMVAWQKGDIRYLEDLSLFPSATIRHELRAAQDGWVSQMDALAIGEAAVLLGAGRAKKTDPVDHSVGLLVHTKVGERVTKGGLLLTLLANEDARLQEALARLAGHIQISDQQVAELPLFYE
jgi:pyrimidine-nucleoside phosphorylase